MLVQHCWAAGLTHGPAGAKLLAEELGARGPIGQQVTGHVTGHVTVT